MKKALDNYASVIDADKFWKWVSVGAEGDCWEWQGGRNTTGYGLHTLNSPDWLYERTGRTKCQLLAHRVAWWLRHGGIGADDRNNHICHTCDNRKCCNPSHMFQGSMYDNVQDMIAKGRARWQR